MNTRYALARNLGIAGVFVATIAFALTPAAAQQLNPPNQLIGTWFNQDPETLGVTQVVLLNRGGKLLVHAWGACMPRDCDQGEAEVTFAHGLATATFDVGFAKDQMDLLRLPSGKLLVIDKPEYLDHPDVKPKEETYFFVLAPESQAQSAVDAKALLRKVAEAHRQLTNAELRSKLPRRRKEKYPPGI